MSPPPSKRKRGHPIVYPDRLFLQALVIMFVRSLPKVHELLTALDEQNGDLQTLRTLLTENGRYPSRRTCERRLKAIPDTLPAQIGCLGHYLVSLIQPWQHSGRSGAIESTVLRAAGGVWHKNDREQGVVPYTAIDADAAWTKSGWHGWVYGWKLHLISVVAADWIPVAALLTLANAADNEVEPALIQEVPPEMRFLLGDWHYNTPNVRQAWETDERSLMTSQYGAYPHSGGGEVRRVFHKLRSRTIENFNEHFKGIFDNRGQVPTKGLLNTQWFAFGAVFVYQLALLCRSENQLPLCIDLKAFLKAA